MNFKKRVNGSWHDIPHYIHKTDTDTITTLPADIFPNATTATVGLKGQAVQSGTPTSDSPVTPEGCGERTGNLCPIISFDKTTDVYYSILFNTPIPAGTYTLSAKITSTSAESRISFRKADMSQIIASNIAIQTGRSQLTVTLNEPCYGMYIYGGTTVFDNIPIKYESIMLNSGSTALLYEPYGYKIPISSAGQTTPVYLGEVHTVRKIKKLVFDGTENLASGSVIGQISYTIAQTPCISSIGLCSHYIIKASLTAPLNFVRISYASYNNGTIIWFELERDQYSTKEEQLAAFKQWLAQQYTNGTPVTVWYVLGTPETAVVNEPLMKIGDYADEVSNISIPTITGKDTFDIQTTLKPSEVSLSYTGWHDATVKEWDGSQWQ